MDNFSSSIYLAEDRVLCLSLFTKENEAYTLRYLRKGIAETDVPDSIITFAHKIQIFFLLYLAMLAMLAMLVFLVLTSLAAKPKALGGTHKAVVAIMAFIKCTY